MNAEKKGKPILKKWWFWVLGVVALMIIFAVIGEFAPKTAMDQQSDQNLKWTVKYPLRNMTLAAARNACLTVFRAQQPDKSDMPAPMTSVDSTIDSTLIGTFNPSATVNYDVKIRLRHEPNGFIMYVSGSDADSATGTGEAATWGDDIAKLLGTKPS